MDNGPIGARHADGDWFLREWMEHTGRIQAQISRDLDWERARVSKLVNGVQSYARADVAALATWLGIEPFELFMRPREAILLRNIRRTAAEIAADQGDARIEPPPTPGAGRDKRA